MLTSPPGSRMLSFAEARLGESRPRPRARRPARSGRPCRRPPERRRPSRSRSPPRHRGRATRGGPPQPGRRSLRTPGRSAARTAYPSIDELRNGGSSTCETTSSASTLPGRLARAATRSVASGSARARTRARASSTERRSLTIARYTRRTGYPRVVISVVIPVHNEERSIALLYDELADSFAARGAAVGGGVRRRRLHRRHLRGADPPPRGARQRPRRAPATELRQGSGARRGVQQRPQERSW